MAKYYTPDISEFHVGFEYESNYNKSNWEVATLKYDDVTSFFEDYVYDASSTEFRVKYLDTEDIKSFGFTHTTSLKGYQENFRIEKLFRRLNEEHDDTMWQNVFLQYAPDIHRVIIRNQISDGSEDETFFEGIIKNKSELKRLLIQLNIIDNEYEE